MEKKMPEREYDLEDRLLEYAAMVLRLCERLHKTPAGQHVRNQLMRSGTSPLFNHGEAEGAESVRDFIHKFRICLKELKESKRALRLIQRVPLISPTAEVDPVLQETEELIKIFGASIRTASRNSVREDRSTQYGAGGLEDDHANPSVNQEIEHPEDDEEPSSLL